MPLTLKAQKMTDRTARHDDLDHHRSLRAANPSDNDQSARSWWIGYFVALVVIAVFDALWLGFVARDFYRRETAAVVDGTVRWVPAVLFYFGYPAGLVTLALWPVPAAARTAAWRSALVGLLAYGTYDLTTLAIVSHWSVTLGVIDILWGTLLSYVAGLAAYMVMRRRGS